MTTILADWTQGVHHDGSARYVSNPLPKMNETVTLRLRVPATAPIKSIFIRIVEDGEIPKFPMQKEQETPLFTLWAGKIEIKQPRLDYHFKLMTDVGAYYYTALGISRAESPDYYDFKLLADYQAPLWVRDQVFYQIFPERFHNGDPTNDVKDGEWIHEGVPTYKAQWGELPTPWRQGRSADFFGGDVNGITQKLDYIQSLGVTALYLTPIFTASTNHHYDINNFHEVDPHFGGNAALAELRAETTKRNIRLMLDITPNHIGVNHHWFAAAQQDHNTPEFGFFFYDEKNKKFENWLGVPLLIKLNYSSQKLRDLIYRNPDSALRSWLQPPYSIDAWRLDVANMTGNLRALQLDHEVWAELRPYLKNDNPDIYIMGEYIMDGTPHTQGDELDAIMNYQGFNIPVRRWLGGEDIGVADEQPYGDTHRLPTDAMALQWQRFIAAVPYVIALQQFNQLDSHDTTRILQVVRGDKALQRLGTALLMAFPGVPCLYYGGEIGMTGGKDPDNRRCMPWDETTWDKDLLAFHQRVIEIRKNAPALKHGGFQMLYAEGDVIAFLREAPEQRILFMGYRGATTLPEITLPVAHGGLADGTALKDLLTKNTYTVQNGALRLKDIARGTALILEVV